MRLDILPDRSDSAAANMAADFLLLKRYPEKTYARFRAYGWHRPAFTFGFSQKIAWVRENLPAEVRADPFASPDLLRRPTGGGIVDHRDDWTYALVLPRGHALETARATDSYRAVHAALAAALQACGQPAVIKDRCDPPPSLDDSAACPATAGPSVCFNRPELFDVIHPDTGRKIAGAAQKRTKEGLLFQGSILRPAAPAVGDWESFSTAFVSALETALGLPAVEAAWPDFPEGEHEALTDHYASAEWRDAR